MGKTDEDLLPEEGKRLRDMTRPKAERIFTSPMKRCIQTAQTLYPDGKIQVVKEFTECDFGEFEYKNYETKIKMNELKNKVNTYINNKKGC